MAIDMDTRVICGFGALRPTKMIVLVFLDLFKCHRAKRDHFILYILRLSDWPKEGRLLCEWASFSYGNDSNQN